MVQMQMICMQRVKDGRCCGCNFTGAKPLQLYKMIRGCTPRGEAEGQGSFAARTLAAESSSRGISASQPHREFSRTSNR